MAYTPPAASSMSADQLRPIGETSTPLAADIAVHSIRRHLRRATESDGLDRRRSLITVDAIARRAGFTISDGAQAA